MKCYINAGFKKWIKESFLFFCFQVEFVWDWHSFFHVCAVEFAGFRSRVFFVESFKILGLISFILMWHFRFSVSSYVSFISTYLAIFLVLLNLLSFEKVLSFKFFNICDDTIIFVPDVFNHLYLPSFFLISLIRHLSILLVILMNPLCLCFSFLSAYFFLSYWNLLFSCFFCSLICGLFLTS